MTSTNNATVPSVTAIVRNSWDFYRKHFRRLWPLFILGGIGEMGFRFSSSSSDTMESLRISPMWLSTIVALAIIFSIVVFVSKIALYKNISDTFKGEIYGIGESYRRAKGLFWSFVFVGILSSTAIFGGYIFLLIPGMILGGYLMYSLFELVHTNKRGFDALLGSWEIIKGRWWRAIWTSILLYITIYLPAIIVVLVIGLISVFVAPALVAANMYTVAMIIFGIIVVVAILLVVAPLTVIASFHLYLEFQSRPIEQPSEIVRNSRKKKLWGSIIVAMVVIVVGATILLVYGGKILNFIQTNSRDLVTRNVLPPVGDMYTFESPTDAYSIDYPVSWGVFDEAFPTQNTYSHGIMFVPKSEFEQAEDLAFPVTSVAVLVVPLPDKVQTSKEFNEYYLTDLKQRENSEISNVVSTSTLIGVMSATQLTYDEVFVSSSSPAVMKPFKVWQTIIVRGDFAYIFSYSASPDRFGHYFEVAQRMFESWNLYHYPVTSKGVTEYFDRKTGFKISYPSEWFQFGAEPSKGIVVGFSAPRYAEDQSFDPNVGAKFSVFKALGNFENELKKIVSGTSYLVKDLKDFRADPVIKTKLDGIDASLVHLTYTSSVDGSPHEVDLILAIKDGLLYRIDFHNVDLETRDQIISSFKFVPQEDMFGFTKLENKRFGLLLYFPNEWEYVRGVDESLTFTDTFLFPKKDDDTFYGSFFVSIPDDYYVNRQVDLAKFRSDSIDDWKKSVSSFGVLETGATTTSRGLPATYMVAEYMNQDPITKVKVLQVYVEKAGVVRFLTFIEDPTDFDARFNQVMQVVKSYDTL